MVNFRYVFAPLFFLLFNSCVTVPKPKKLYVNFPEKNKEFNQIHLLMDNFMMKDIKGSTHAIDFKKMEEDAQTVFDIIASSLTAKGYKVGEKKYFSAGAIRGAMGGEYVVMNPPDGLLENFDPEKFYRPPFFLGSKFQKQSEQAKNLDFFKKSIQNQKKMNQKRPPIWRT